MDHLAVPSETGKSLECLEKDSTQDFSNEQRIWFSSLAGVHGVEVSICTFVHLTCSESSCNSCGHLSCALRHLSPLQLVKDVECRIRVIGERPLEPQPKPQPPQPSPRLPVPREGDGALCQEVTGERMWSSPPSVSNVLSQCVTNGCTVSLRG